LLLVIFDFYSANEPNNAGIPERACATPEVFEVQVVTSISAPSGCYHLVSEYKKICQSRLEAFKENNCVIDAVDE